MRKQRRDRPLRAGRGGESPEAVVQRGLEALRALGMFHREKRGGRCEGSEGDMNGHGEGGESDAGGGGESGSGGGGGGGRHVCVVAHSRFNKLIIASLRGDVSQAAKVSQGNACVNVIDFSVGGGACRVVRLNERDHLLSAQLRDTLRDGVCEICLGHGSGV